MHTTNEYVDLVREVAKINQRNQHYLMVEGWKRNGFACGLNDLLGLNEDNQIAEFKQLGIRPKTERRWRLVSLPTTTLISFPVSATHEDFAEIHIYLNAVLGQYAWYEKPNNVVRAPSEYMPNPHPDAKNFTYFPVKILGKNGNNPAVDPILLIVEKEGNLKILAGKRFSGEYALPGGMAEADVRATCLNELLEEVYGGSLFDGESENSLDADAIQQQQPNKFKTAMDTCLNEIFTQDTDAKKQINAEKIAELLKSATPVKTKFDQIAEVLQAAVEAGAMRPADKNHWLLRIKCQLYANLLPDKYAKLKDLVYKKLETGVQVVNQSDPRNTALASMVTTPVFGVITIEELHDLAEQSGLSMKAGDDLEVPSLVEIEHFGFAYSDHATLVLNAIAQKLQDGKLALTPKLREQLAELGQIVAHKSDYIAAGVHARITEMLADKNLPNETIAKIKDILAEANTGQKSSIELNTALDAIMSRLVD